MRKIYIKTTETCNLHCKHCYIGDNRTKQGFFNAEKTIAWLKKQIDNGKNTLISFHGGEPFLCSLDEMQKVCDAFPEAEFDATSNLCFKNIKPIMAFIQKNFIRNETGKQFVKTSWDYDIRFPNKEAQHLWENNVKTLLKNNIDVKVITCLSSKFIHNVSPIAYKEYIKQLGVNEIDFERLTANTTKKKELLPNYDEVDEWLLDFYENNDCFEVGMFANMAAAVCGTFIDCRARHCMQNTYTINANGTIGGCPNTAIIDWFADISGQNNIIKRNELIKHECVRNPVCYTCELYRVCNGDCHQLSWKDGKCPEPKKLLRRIIDDVAEKKNTLVFDA